MSTRRKKTVLGDIVDMFMPGMEVLIKDYVSGKVLYTGQGFYLTGIEKICKCEIKEFQIKDNVLSIKIGR